MTEQCSFQENARHAAEMAPRVFASGRLAIGERNHLEGMPANLVIKNGCKDNERVDHFGRHKRCQVFTAE